MNYRDWRRPIRSEDDYQAVLQRIEELWDAPAGTSEADELEVLAILVEAHEKEHSPIQAPDPIEAIRFRMEQSGMSPRDLEACIGTRGRVSEILSGKRRLTLGMILRLHHDLGIPTASLLGKP